MAAADFCFGQTSIDRSKPMDYNSGILLLSVGNARCRLYCTYSVLNGSNMVRRKKEIVVSKLIPEQWFIR